MKNLAMKMLCSTLVIYVASICELFPAELSRAAAGLPAGWGLPRRACLCERDDDVGGWQAKFVLRADDGVTIQGSSLRCPDPEAACSDAFRLITETSQILRDLAQLQEEHTRWRILSPANVMIPSEILPIAA